MKKEKHIFVLNILHEDRFGGPGKRIINVSQLLNKRNIKTTICLPYGSGNIEEAAKKGNIPVIRLPFSRIPRFSDLRQLFKWIAYLPRDLKSFYSCFKNNKPDLVHINGAFFFVPAVAAKMVGVPLVWHMNDTMPGPILARFFGIIVKLLADRIVTAAEAVAEHYGVDKVPHSVLYAPVNTSLFSYIDYKRTKKINTIPKVSLIANWNRIKGIDNFIQAMAIVIKVYGPVEIHFAGEKLSNHRKYIQNIEQQIDSLNIRQFVYHHGFINSVETLLETMDVHVLSSLKEACPMTVLEGMAAGVPVVSTDVGGVGELLCSDPEKPAGIIVPAKNIKAIAEAIIELLKNPEKSIKYGTNGRKIVNQRFSLQTCADRHLNLYNAVLAK